MPVKRWRSVGIRKRRWVGTANPVPLTGILDNFNRADGALSGGIWSGTTPALVVSTNRLTATGGGNHAFTTATYTDCEVYATSVTADASQLYLWLREVSGFSGYAIHWNNNGQIFLSRFDSAAETTLAGSLTGIVADGDTVLFRAKGNSLQVWVKKASTGLWGRVIQANDATYTTGRLGLGIFSAAEFLDDFSGGSLVTVITKPVAPTTNIAATSTVSGTLRETQVPATSILDSFNRADGALSGGIWSGAPNLVVSSNQVTAKPATGGDHAFTTSNYGPDCEAYCTISTGLDLTYLWVREIAGFSGYQCHWTSAGQVFLSRYDAAAETTLAGSALGVVATGDTVLLRARGSSIEAWVKKSGASVFNMVLSVTDATYTAAARIGFSVFATTYSVDNFGGGTIGAVIPGVINATSTVSGGVRKRAPIDIYTVLLLHADGTNGSTSFPDSSPYRKTVTAGGAAQVSTAQSEFGGASASFASTNDVLTVPTSPDFGFGTDDFTVECWVRFTSVPTTCNFVRFGAGAPDRAWFFGYGSGNLLFNGTPDGTNLIYDESFAWTPIANTWYHVAVARQGNNLKAFVNGSQVGLTVTTVGVNIRTATNQLRIGSDVGGINPVTGFLDEIRISKGIARWTANFVPPTDPYGLPDRIYPAAISATSTVSGSVAHRPFIITLAINATSTVSGAIRAVRKIAPASVAATSTVSGAIVVRRAVAPGQINATSTVTGTVVVIRRVTAAAIAATSTVSGSVAKIFKFVPATVQATSTVSGSLRVIRAIIPVSISATSTVAGAVTRVAVTRAIVPAQINATSTVSGSVAKIFRVVTAQISATSTVSGALAPGLRRVIPAAINATSTVSGTVSRLRRPIPATINATSSVSGNVTATKLIVVFAAINAQSTVSGKVTATKLIKPASIAATSTVSGFTAIKVFRGVTPTVISATSTVSGNLVRPIRVFVLATINATSTVSGSLRAIRRIIPANVAATSTVSGSLVSPRRAIVAAQVNATSTVSGSVRVVRGIIPTNIAATSTVSGAVTARKAVVPAAINATSTVSGSLRAIRRVITANIAATSTFSGVVSKVGAPIPLPVQLISATSTVSGNVTAKKLVVPTSISATSTVSGAVRVIRRITAAQIAATSTVSGSIVVIRRIAPLTINATSTVSGAVARIRPVVPAQINATSTVTGVFSKVAAQKFISGTINAVSTVSGTVRVLRRIIPAQINATSIVSGSVTPPGRFIVPGNINAVSTVAGAVRVLRRISPTAISATSFLSGTVRVIRRIAPATINSVSTLSGTIHVIYRIAGVINATSTISGQVTAKKVIYGNIFATSTVSGRVFVPVRAIIELEGFAYRRWRSLAYTHYDVPTTFTQFHTVTPTRLTGKVVRRLKAEVF